jgi:arylsulfatase A-like enzyme
MKARLLSALLLAAACSRPAPAPPPPPITPAASAASPAPLVPRLPAVDGIVLVTIDTLRSDALGIHQGLAETPVLDSLAREGWDFTHCYSASMLTNPSHASLMTSLYPRDHGVYDNESGVRDDARTLAAALQRRGLRTLAVVSFPHLNPEVSGLGNGFDEVVRAERVDRRGTETTRLALAALDRSAPRGPFFLWVHYTDPHAPYTPPDDASVPSLPMHTPMSQAVRAATRVQLKNPWFKGIFRREKFTEAVVARYYGEVNAADRAVGDLVRGLAERGRLDKTALVITSDHGENLGEHHLFFHHGGLYRETVQVPLIVRIPGRAAARVDGLVETVDVAPTILELAGAAPWEPMRGHSLLGVVAGASPARTSVFSEHMNGELAALRTADTTLIVHRKSSGQFPSYAFVAGREEVYDLTTDPGELHPLTPPGPRGQALAAQLWRLVGQGPSPVATRRGTADRESLRALGYIE